MEENNNDNLKQRIRKGIETAKKSQLPKHKKVLMKPTQKKAIKTPGALKKANPKLPNKKSKELQFEEKAEHANQTFKNNKEKFFFEKLIKNTRKRPFKTNSQLVKDIKIEKNDQNKENKQDVKKIKTEKNLSSPKRESKRPKNNQDVGAKKKVYNCKICEYQTTYLSSYKIHSDIHKGIKYECQACLHKAASKGALLAHMRSSLLCKPHLDPTKQEKKSRGPQKKYRCVLCSYESSTKKCLSDHKLIHLPKDQQPQFRCEFCPFVAIRKNNFMRHKRLLHAENIGIKMETLYCYHCDYTTIYKVNLVDHIKRHFRERKIYACDYCDLTFIYKMAYLQHQQTHLTKGLKFECPAQGCKYWVPKKYMLKKHMIKHQSDHQVRMYQCPNCSHRTKYRASFKKHLEKMCNISWEQWKQEHDQRAPPKNKETDKENAQTPEVVSEHVSESETEWEFSLSDQEI